MSAPIRIALLEPVVRPTTAASRCFKRDPYRPSGT